MEDKSRGVQWRHEDFVRKHTHWFRAISHMLFMDY